MLNSNWNFSGGITTAKNHVFHLFIYWPWSRSLFYCTVLDEDDINRKEDDEDDDEDFTEDNEGEANDDVNEDDSDFDEEKEKKKKTKNKKRKGPVQSSPSKVGIKPRASVTGLSIICCT